MPIRPPPSSLWLAGSRRFPNAPRVLFSSALPATRSAQAVGKSPRVLPVVPGSPAGDNASQSRLGPCRWLLLVGVAVRTAKPDAAREALARRRTLDSRSGLWFNVSVGPERLRPRYHAPQGCRKECLSCDRRLTKSHSRCGGTVVLNRLRPNIQFGAVVKTALARS